MNISFNRISNIKFNNNVRTPSFKSSDLGEDKFVKSSETSNDTAFNDVIDEILSGLSGKEVDIAKRVIDEKIVFSFFDFLCNDKKFHSAMRKTPQSPVAILFDGSEEQKISETMLKYLDKAKIKKIKDLSAAIDVYNTPRVKNTFDKATLEFFEIYGQIQDKRDFVNYPELLLHLNDLYHNQEPEKLTKTFSAFTQVLKFVEAKNIDEFKEKFGHLSSDFNDFNSIHDISKAVISVFDTCPKKLDLLSPFVSGKTTDEIFDNACALYVSNPDIIDTLYKENNGESLGDIKEILPFALARKDLSKRGLALLSPSFNDFSTPQDKLRFYRLLNNNDVSVNNFKKLYSNLIISDVEPISFIHNKQSIIENLTKKEKNNVGNATAIYFNFADVLNVAYLAENSSDIIDQTHSLIKNCKFKSSSDILNFYNQCNVHKKKVKSISSEELVDFIDLMRFVDKSVLSDSKKMKTIRLEELRQLRNEYNSVKEPIEQFLLNSSNNLFLEETPFSIFKKYRNEFVGASVDEINSKLSDIDKFNIKNPQELFGKNLEMQRFGEFFSSQNELTSFIIKNEISFDKSKEDEEYKQDCRFILSFLYNPNDVEGSLSQIKKLSDSKFLIKSKNLLSNLILLNLSYEQRRKLIDVILNNDFKTYANFEKFLQKYQVDKKSPAKLIEFLDENTKNLSFSEIETRLNDLDTLLKESNFPLLLNADNIANLSYDDLLQYKTVDNNINLKVLNKLLDLQSDVSPVLALPNVYTKQNDASKYRITSELLGTKSNAQSYSKLISFLFGNQALKDLSHTEIVDLCNDVPDYFVDFVNRMSTTSTGKNYNMSLHSKLRIIERFLMLDIKSDEDFNKPEIKQKLQNVLDSIYNQEQLLMKKSSEGERILFNSLYDGKEIESVFTKSGILITAVEKTRY